MPSNRWFSSRLLLEIAGWLCLLAVLALVAVATSGALETVLTLAAVIAAVVAVGRSGSDTNGVPGPERDAPLLVMIAPALVGLLIASELVSDEWYAFTAIAIGFPLLLVWRPLYWHWQDRRASHDAA